MMTNQMDETLKSTIQEMADNYSAGGLFSENRIRNLPSRSSVVEVLHGLRDLLFPGYFTNTPLWEEPSSFYIGHHIYRIFEKMKQQVEIALRYHQKVNLPEEEHRDIAQEAECICLRFFDKLPQIQRKVLMDVEACYEGDPAANSREEVIFSYPGLFAIYVYRLAHELYVERVPFIPRIMTEYAHSKTGIDINAGATIGDYFFIDHGTGIVIGETTEIGKNVKIYQSVTLGALSTRGGQRMSGVKRHPTIGDNVTIYSGATILGGNTVIGEGCVIGGNTFIVESIPPRTKVSIKNQELVYKSDSSFTE